LALYLEPTSLNRANSSSSIEVAMPLSSFSLTLTSLHSSMRVLKTSCKEFRTLSLVASLLLCLLGTASEELLTVVGSLGAGLGAICFRGELLVTIFTVEGFVPATGVVEVGALASDFAVLVGLAGDFPIVKISLLFLLLTNKLVIYAYQFVAYAEKESAEHPYQEFWETSMAVPGLTQPWAHFWELC